MRAGARLGGVLSPAARGRRQAVDGAAGVETELLELLAPEIARGLKGEAEDEATVLRRARLWAYLAALDRSTARRPVPPSNSLLLAVLMLPPLRDALDPDSNAVRDVGQMVALGIQPSLERLRASRRDGELARQILLAIRYILPSKKPRRKRPRLAGREFFDEALRLCEIISDAEAENPALAGKPIVVEGASRPTWPRVPRARRRATKIHRPSWNRWSRSSAVADGDADAARDGTKAGEKAAAKDGTMRVRDPRPNRGGCPVSRRRPPTRPARTRPARRRPGHRRDRDSLLAPSGRPGVPRAWATFGGPRARRSG